MSELKALYTRINGVESMRQMKEVPEAPGVYKGTGEIGGYWFRSEGAWQGPFESATDCAVARMQWT